MKKVFYLFLVLSSFLFADVKWWNENFEYRLPLTLKNETSSEIKIPVVIKGKEIIKNTGLKNIKVSSIRIVDSEGNEIPSQIDEKDEKYKYQKEGDFIIGDEDEIVFIASLKPKENKKYFIYFRTKATPFPEYGKVKLFEKVVFSSLKPFNGLLKNKFMSVGIRGSGEEVEKRSDGKERKYFGGKGKGCITSFMIKNDTVQLVHINSAWSYYMLGHPFQGKAEWNNPEEVHTGAVRTVVKVESKPFIMESFKYGHHPQTNWTVVASNNSGSFKGKLIRYYILYKNVPYLEFKEIFLGEEVSPDIVFTYLVLFNFGKWDKGDVLIIPVANKIFRIKYEDNRNYDTKMVSEGWMACESKKENTGIALLFEKDKCVYAHGTLLRSYVRKKLEEKGEEPKYSNSHDFVVSYKVENAGVKKIFPLKLGFYIFENDSIDSMRDFYKSVFENKLKKEFGFVEEK